jgi:flagellin-like protein
MLARPNNSYNVFRSCVTFIYINSKVGKRMSRKAVSPLIATVLLLAFAVALVTTLLQILDLGCPKGRFAEMDGAARICISDGALEMFVRNEDKSKTIPFITVTISGRNDSDNPTSNVSIEPLQEKKIVVPYDASATGEIYEVGISTKGFKACRMQQLSQDIPRCQ